MTWIMSFQYTKSSLKGLKLPQASREFSDFKNCNRFIALAAQYRFAMIFLLNWLDHNDLQSHNKYQGAAYAFSRSTWKLPY